VTHGEMSGLGGLGIPVCPQSSCEMAYPAASHGSDFRVTKLAGLH
jgi:hypothetical protein